jgi:hypothetical protein
LFRHGSPREPHRQASRLLANLATIGPDLDPGSIVIIEPGRPRIRAVPLPE